MQDTTSDLTAGQARYVRTLIQTGLPSEVAYTLAEDVTAMARDSNAGEIRTQGESIRVLAREMNAKFEAQTSRIESLREILIERGQQIGAVEGRLSSTMESMDERLTGAMESMDKRLTGAMQLMDERLTGAMQLMDERLTGAMESMDERLTGAMESMDERLTGAMESMEKRHINAMESMEGRLMRAVESMDKRHADAMQSMERRLTSAIKSSENKLGGQYNRLVNHQLKLLWVIVGSGTLAMLGAIGKWIFESLKL